ncbi:RNase P modulator RnpM [Marinicrinis lubricantis]|uniref:RNase P modulator RnpM n=1 Tax=Marinicrinis lubricantis TaxID=2086470 RepID=A0ABW1IMH7_9BACL
MKQRKVPLRKCIACQKMLSKKELIRIVKTPEDDIVVDFTGKKSGRGAYTCGSLESVAMMRKTRALERALGCTIPAEVYDRIEAEIREKNRQVICAKEGTAEVEP